MVFIKNLTEGPSIMLSTLLSKENQSATTKHEYAVVAIPLTVISV